MGESAHRAKCAPDNALHCMAPHPPGRPTATGGAIKLKGRLCIVPAGRRFASATGLDLSHGTESGRFGRPRCCAMSPCGQHSAPNKSRALNLHQNYIGFQSSPNHGRRPLPHPAPSRCVWAVGAQPNRLGGILAQAAARPRGRQAALPAGGAARAQPHQIQFQRAAQPPGSSSPDLHHLIRPLPHPVN